MNLIFRSGQGYRNIKQDEGCEGSRNLAKELTSSSRAVTAKYSCSYNPTLTEATSLSWG